MFDRYHCIILSTMQKKNKKNPGNIWALFFGPIAIWLFPTCAIHFYKNSRFKSWSAIVISVQPLAAVHKSMSLAVKFSLNAVCSSICMISEAVQLLLQVFQGYLQLQTCSRFYIDALNLSYEKTQRESRVKCLVYTWFIFIKTCL